MWRALHQPRAGRIHPRLSQRLEREWHRRRRRKIRPRSLSPEENGLLEIRGLDLEFGARPAKRWPAMSDATSEFPLAMLADDVTGGCDAGVQFSLRGAATRVYLELPQAPDAFAGVSVIVNHSRGEAPEEASRKVEQACDWIAASGAKLCFKKIDSTL